MDAGEERRKKARRAANAKVVGYELRRTRERYFICPNDILEREFRTFIVSG
jgi:hypothetical protein